MDRARTHVMSTRCAVLGFFFMLGCGAGEEAGYSYVAVPAAATTVIVNPPLSATAEGRHVAEEVVLRNVGSGRCLDVPRRAHESRTMLWTWECNGTVAQKWLLQPSGNGYVLTSKASAKCLDVPYANKKNNITLWQYDCNHTAAQRWVLERGADGTFLVRSGASNLCLDVPHAQASNGVG